MNLNVNRGAWAGTLSFAPELRNTQSGQSVCKTGLTIVESWSDKKTGEVKESKVIVKLLAWGDLAAQLAECAAGDNIYVEGALKGDKKKDDTWETVVNIRFLQRIGADAAPAPEPRKADGKWKSRPTQHTLPAAEPVDDSDDLKSCPF